MSVLGVFGANLRLLSATRGTQVAVARALDIGKVQFQRYLKGTSFPRPDVLRRVCDYFGVDARILTEPLTEPLLQAMVEWRHAGPPFAFQDEWTRALSYATPHQNYFDDPDLLANGLYAFWRGSFSRPDTVVRMLVRVFRHDGVKVFRGYGEPTAFPAGTSAACREYRGLCLWMQGGYALLQFSASRDRVFILTYISGARLRSGQDLVYHGLSTISQVETAGVPRVSGVVLQRIDPSPRNLVRQAHLPTDYRPDEVPADLRPFILGPVA